MSIRATAAPGALIRLEAQPGISETPDNKVHLRASAFSGNATLCGYLSDYYKPVAQPTSERVTCHGCLDIVRHVQSLRVRIRKGAAT